MTLVATLHTPQTIWMLADRRLYYGPNRYKDNACKIMTLETNGETALLGYAGLGATARGTEPSDWMSNVLRGRTGKLEDLLGLLAQASKNQLPTHLLNFPRQFSATHDIVIPAYVGGRLNVYSINVSVDRSSTKATQNFKRHTMVVKHGVTRIPRSCSAGSGAILLLAHPDRLAAIRKLADAHDRGKVSELAIADELAKLNLFIHQNTSDNTVGPRCIVAWRYNKSGVHHGGGGHQYYTGRLRDKYVPAIPTIANGMDIRAIAGLYMPDIQKTLTSNIKLPLTFDHHRIDTELQSLPTDPDEQLR